jgi:hypothetical protein
MPIHFVEDLDIGLLQIGSNSYQDIYVSLGGKFNESLVRVNDNKFYSNASYQMIPQYIRRTTEKTLIIVIDRFYNEDNRRENIKLLELIMMKCNLDVLVDVLMVNHDTTTKKIKTITRSILEFVKDHNVPPDKYVFCNYIKFIYPNAIENVLDEKLPNRINSAHKEYSMYEDRFYQWYGYNYQTYNLVFCYNRYNYAWMIHRPYLSHHFTTSFRNITLNTGNASMLTTMGINDIRLEKIVDSFIKNSFDITWHSFTNLNI